VHGWVYGLSDGLLKDLQCTMDRPETVVEVFAAALKRYPRAADAADSAEAPGGGGAVPADD
jgi:carbonic anhydrase